MLAPGWTGNVVEGDGLPFSRIFTLEDDAMETQVLPLDPWVEPIEGWLALQKMCRAGCEWKRLSVEAVYFNDTCIACYSQVIGV
jgi:hypothetical protein